ncbi:MAG: hypothetical protein PVH21_16920 [Myxococcales bacterium]|jgi:hypothetical protein
MKYIVQIEIEPTVGNELEDNPQRIRDMIAKWQAHNPIGFYFSLARRTVTVILEADNEDAFFPALHATWRITKSYPDVHPVGDVDEFPEMLKRAGVGG